MRISVVKPDNIVVVDGVARQVDLSDQDPALHAIQWDGANGEYEYKNSTGPIQRVADFSELQLFLDRWIVAAPPPPPPPSPPQPPTKDEMIDRTLADPVLKLLLLELAGKAGLSEADLRAAVKAKLP